MANEIAVRERQGLGRVQFACVAAHIGIKGNEEADKLVKEATDEEALIVEITEGGLKQKWKAIRASERAVVGFGGGRISKLSRAAEVMYAHLSTNKGNLQRWRFIIGRSESEECRGCGKGPENGSHVAIGCMSGEARGRR